MNTKFSTVFLALFLPASGFASDAEIESWAKPVDSKVLAWRRDIHQFPELGNREFRTSKLVAEHLRSLGLDVTTGIAHTGVIAILKGGKPGPRIAMRADMDALPVTETSGLPFASKQVTDYRGEKTGVMHACGHDSHTAILMGVAEAMAKNKAQLAGEVLFIFQPAEEGPPEGETGGAVAMLADGIFKQFKPEVVYGMHVWSALNANQIGYRSGPAMAASDIFRIIVKGRQTHGSRPWGGIDPIVAAADIISTAQSIVSRRMNISELPVVLTFGVIKGGIRNNIIPDQVEMMGTIRTFDEGMRQKVFAELKRVAENVAAAHGATVVEQIPLTDGNPVLVNNPALTERSVPSLIKVAGAANVVKMGLVMGAEDFADYANEVPGFFFFVGSTPVGKDAVNAPSNHSPEFFLDEAALPLATRALLQVSLDYLNGDHDG